MVSKSAVVDAARTARRQGDVLADGASALRKSNALSINLGSKARKVRRVGTLGALAGVTAGGVALHSAVTGDDLGTSLDKVTDEVAGKVGEVAGKAGAAAGAAALEGTGSALLASVGLTPNALIGLGLFMAASSAASFAAF